MWQDIIQSIILSTSEALFFGFLDKRKSKKLIGSLRSIMEMEFIEFADTSLDTNDFHSLVESKQFEELIRNYYYTINDGDGISEYKMQMLDYIKKKCVKSSSIEIKRFIDKIEMVYTKSLMDILKTNYELFAMLQLLTVSQRNTLSKINESKDYLIKYMESINRNKNIISDDIIMQYHSNCKMIFSKINFTGIVGIEHKKNKKLKEFYVKNTFSFGKVITDSRYNILNQYVSKIQLKNIFDYGNKIVILGGAGHGKSTTLNYLFCNYEKIFKDNLVKIKIDLKEYAYNIVSKKISILECICKEFEKHISYSKISDISLQNVIANYLDKGSCLIILDALDEIPSQHSRDKVRDEISLFCDIYSLNKIIITSREVGYLRNQFDDSFFHLRINNFSAKQIKKYSQKWHKNNKLNTDFKDFWQNFSQEVNRSKCNEMITNPIILILALVIFDTEKNLPNRRVDFYKKCIQTFLVERENRKNAFNMSNNCKNILSDDTIIPRIANYRFEHFMKDEDYMFNYDEIQNSILGAIDDTVNIRWLSPANEFRDYLINRTELIRAVDENNYDFAHKTFSEYFLAVYYAKVYNEDELIHKLEEWIGDSNYDELAKLIIEVVIEKNDSDQHKAVISFLFRKINELTKCALEGENSSLNTNYKSSRQKSIDYFSLAVELYRNNMIQLKYQDFYYECIIRNTELLDYINMSRIVSKIPKKEFPNYDIEHLIEYYIENITIKEKNFYNTIRLFIFLDKKGKEKLAKKNQLYKLLIDFFECSYEKETNICSVEMLYNEMLENNLDIILNSPEAFLQIFILKAKFSKLIFPEKIFQVSFKQNAVFMRLTRPQNLFEIFLCIYDTPEMFLAGALSIIHCGKYNTNYLLAYFLKDSGQRIIKREEYGEEKVHEVRNNALIFYYLYLKSNTFEKFIVKAKELKIYDNRMRDLYQMLYNEFKQDYEKIGKDEVKQVIDRVNTRGKNFRKYDEENLSKVIQSIRC